MFNLFKLFHAINHKRITFLYASCNGVFQSFDFAGRLYPLGSLQDTKRGIIFGACDRRVLWLWNM